MLTDPHGRRLDYLRLSVTDRCNLRCLYCLPASFSDFMPADGLLTDDEVVRLVGCFAALGVAKLRVTGGEPLVRPGLAPLLGRLARVEGISEISLSTNGVLLAPVARELARAGLRRVNVSLDTLRPERFRRITRFGSLADVLSGIEAATRAGLTPVKLNVVVARGMNDDEIGDFARLADVEPLHVRFIELMPMGDAGFFSPERCLAAGEIARRAGPLEPLSSSERPLGHGPARYYRRRRALGTIGIISALTCGFCDGCNRLRLDASGALAPCLDSHETVPLGAALRAGAGDGCLKELIRGALALKPAGHRMRERLPAASANPRLMCRVGG